MLVCMLLSMGIYMQKDILSKVQYVYQWQIMNIYRNTTLTVTAESGLVKDLDKNIQGIESLLYPFIQLIEERRKMLSNARNSLYIDAWKAAEKRYDTVLWQSDDTYVQDIHQLNIPIIKLTVPKERLQKYMVQKYYKMSFDHHDRLNYHNKKIKYASLNTGDLNKALSSPLPFNYTMLNMKYPIKGVDNDSHITVGFIHVLSDAIVLPEGEVLYKDVKLHPGGCRNNNAPHLTKHSAHEVQFADQVFSISQFWGYGFFHATIEDMPRIVPYLPFLRKNKQIKIHVLAKLIFTREMLALLGIEEERLISGYVRCRIIYMPMGTTCGGSGNIFNIQLLSKYCRRTMPQTTKDADKSLVLIKRSVKRIFTHHDQILRTLRLMCLRYNKTIEVFADNPVPSFHKSMQMFNSASMIVGPHGAGLSNMIFAKPGTIIVEAVCTVAKQGRANICYAYLSFLLGHIYYGVIPSRDCTQVTQHHLVPPVNSYLKWLQ